MNEFSSFERSPYSQSVTLPIQPFDQVSFSGSPTDSLSGNVLPLLTMGLFIAIAFFRMGVGFRKRSQRRYDLIQTLERIWQLSAHRND